MNYFKAYEDFLKIKEDHEKKLDYWMNVKVVTPPVKRDEDPEFEEMCKELGM